MKLVILESPYAGEVERNIRYARRAVRDSLRRGESPIASHLLYTQPGILDDAIPEERALGIKAGLVWAPVAKGGFIFYIDYGWSNGMKQAMQYVKDNGFIYSCRTIGTNEDPHTDGHT